MAGTPGCLLYSWLWRCLRCERFDVELLERLEQCSSCFNDAFLVDRIPNGVLVEANIRHGSFSRIGTLDRVISVFNTVTDDVVIPHPLRHHSVFSVQLFDLRALVPEMFEAAFVFGVCCLERLEDGRGSCSGGWCSWWRILCACSNFRTWPGHSRLRLGFRQSHRYFVVFRFWLGLQHSYRWQLGMLRGRWRVATSGASGIIGVTSMLSMAGTVAGRLTEARSVGLGAAYRL